MPNTQASCVLVSGRHGCYAQQSLVTNFGDRLSITDEDRAILAAGPDHPDYCEVEICDLTITADDGLVWTLDWRDGDIIAVHPDAQWCHDHDTYEIKGPDNLYYWVGEQFAVVIANSDTTGIDDVEEQLLDDFLTAENPDPQKYFWTIGDHTDGFRRCEVTGLMSSCVELVLVKIGG